MRERMRDETLLWIYLKFKEHNDRLPPDKRIGLQKYLRENGIISPERQHAIDYREIPFSHIHKNIADILGDDYDGEEENQ